MKKVGVAIVVSKRETLSFKRGGTREKRGEEKERAEAKNRTGLGSKRFAGFQWRPLQRFPVISERSNAGFRCGHFRS